MKKRQAIKIVRKMHSPAKYKKGTMKRACLRFNRDIPKFQQPIIVNEGKKKLCNWGDAMYYYWVGTYNCYIE